MHPVGPHSAQPYWVRRVVVGAVAVVVVTGLAPVGIITERDFVSLIAVGDDPTTVEVGERNGLAGIEKDVGHGLYCDAAKRALPPRDRARRE